jgi:hypothetical protein
METGFDQSYWGLESNTVSSLFDIARHMSEKGREESAQLIPLVHTETRHTTASRLHFDGVCFSCYPTKEQTK